MPDVWTLDCRGARACREVVQVAMSGWCGGSGGGEKLQPELRCADGMLVSREQRGLSGDI